MALRLTRPLNDLKFLKKVDTDAILSSVPAEGRPFVLEAWATWCGPCHQAFPHLSELRRKFAPRGLVVVGITQETENDNPSLQSFVDRKGADMDYNVASDTSGYVVSCISSARRGTYGAVNCSHFKEVSNNVLNIISLQ